MNEKRFISWRGLIAVGLIVLSVVAGIFSKPVSTVQVWEIAESEEEGGFVLSDGTKVPGSAALEKRESGLYALRGKKFTGEPPAKVELIVDDGAYFEARVSTHYGPASLLPAIVAVVLCFLLREPVVALAGGVVAAGFLMQKYDIANDLLVPAIGTPGGATILILYLWFLGGLMGMWSRTGAAAACASWVTHHFVRGPRGAKFVTWLLGVIFFQGGTLSTVLVGTTVRPIADRQKVSHEELSYIVDSTASPIAVLLPFNAWPIYVQSLIFVAGVPLLASEAGRISFFFQSIPLFFYAGLSVLFTLLLCWEKLPFTGPALRKAIHRAKNEGLIDRPGSNPLLSKEIEEARPAAGYSPNLWEFLAPLFIIIGATVGTFCVLGKPMVLWGFGIALAFAFLCAVARGMAFQEAVDGMINGWKGVVYGSVILLLAITVGYASRQTGAGFYLVETFGSNLNYVALPLTLAILTMVTAFSTGTSFGTFAVILPIGMPVAWAVASAQGLANPELYLMICFAAMINGSVFGDQCSPISDTTVLSALSTGCDLMDHVRTQLFPSMVAMGFALLGWLVLTVLFAGPA